MSLNFYLDDVLVTEENPNEASLSNYAIQLALASIRTNPRYQDNSLSPLVMSQMMQEFEALFSYYRERLSAAIQNTNASQ